MLKKKRWQLVFLLFLAGIVNYFDRIRVLGGGAAGDARSWTLAIRSWSDFLQLLCRLRDL